MIALVDESGRPLSLGERLGQGGEGTVYRLAGQRDMAVKVYSKPLSTERERKIAVLSSRVLPELQRFTAWPAALVRDKQGQPRGLLMPVIEGCKDIHQLYSPRGRRQHFPQADWRFLIHVATNLSRAFAAVHAQKLVIGDVNHGSVLVSSDGTVRLIDIDSFQVPLENGHHLLCTVAVPLFLPPELYGAKLDCVVRTSNHDAFGLAILIFMLLLQGRHPFAGRYLATGEMPIERAISEYRFAFSQNAAKAQMAPPPNAVGLDVLPADVRTMLEHAFSNTGALQSRPSASQWVDALSTLSSSLGTCAVNTTHHFLPWASNACPWCKFERSTGVFLFGVPVHVGGTDRLETEYKALLREALAISPPRVAAAPFTGPALPAQENAVRARAIPPALLFGYIVAGAALIAGLVLAPLRSPLLGLGFIALAIAAGAKGRRRAPWIAAYRSAKTEYERSTTKLARVNQLPKFSLGQQRMETIRNRWEELPALRSRRLGELERNKRREQLEQFLERYTIEDAGVQGIGPSRLAMLAAYGIESAADIEAGRVQQVPQFGVVLTTRLVDWRQQLERRFVYDASKPLPPMAVARLDKELEDRRRHLMEELRQAVKALREASLADSQAMKEASHQAEQASQVLRQAEADVLAATGGVPA